MDNGALSLHQSLSLSLSLRVIGAGKKVGMAQLVALFSSPLLLSHLYSLLLRPLP